MSVLRTNGPLVYIAGFIKSCSIVFQCHHLVESHEEDLEDYWFKVWAKKKDTDLLTWFCIEKMKGKKTGKKIMDGLSLINNCQGKYDDLKVSTKQQKLQSNCNFF